MTREDIDEFIRIMKTLYEDWTPERVEEKYGDLTLRQALEQRMQDMQSGLQTFWKFVEEEVRPDAEARGLWPKTKFPGEEEWKQ